MDATGSMFTRKFVYLSEHFRKIAALYLPSGKLICNRNHLKNTEDLVLVIGPVYLSRQGDW